MQEFAITISIAVIGGLVWLAFYHPNGYQKIHYILIVFGLLCYSTVTALNAGLTKAIHINEVHNIDPKIQEEISSLKILDDRIIYIFALLFVLFMIAMPLLPFLNDKTNGKIK